MRSGLKNITFNGAPCAFFDGMFDYFNLNEVEYKAKFPGQKWNGPCVKILLLRHKILLTTSILTDQWILIDIY